MDLLANKVFSGCMDLFGLPFCAQVARPIRLPFCSQVTWTYMIPILCSGWMDLNDCHFVFRLHRPIQSVL